MVMANPGEGAAAHKLSQFFRYAEGDGQRRAQIWMPPSTRLPPDSLWWPLLQQGRVRPRCHPSPALLLLSEAADWSAARTLYGGERLLPPRLQLFCGSDLDSWGHGASQLPAIRVALGPAVHQGLSRAGVLREPIQRLPIGLDPEDLPPPARQRRQGEVLILASRNPDLGLAVQAELRGRELRCRTELTPWPLQQWQQALAEAAVAVVLAPPQPSATLGLRRLAAMGLQTPLVCNAPALDDGLCRDDVNALVRSADPQALAQAAALLLARGQGALRQRLIDGGLATMVRHRRARERLEFGQLLEHHRELWQEACRCHPEAAAQRR